MTHSPQRRRLITAAGAASLGGLALPAAAQAWPTGKPIRILVGFQPGGTTDPYARTYGEYVGQKLGATIVVENRPGAGGWIALEMLARSPADGYTFGITTTGSVWGSRALYNRVPFEPDKDFVPVSLLPVGPLVFAVPASLPVKNVDEWVAYAKKYSVSMASYAPASVPHLTVVELNRSKGTNIAVTQYKGEGPMWPDVANGIVHAGVGTYVAASPHLQRGMLKVLATFGTERNPKLPAGIKSMTEQGYDAPLFKLDGGLVMLAPVGTPEPIVRRVSELMIEAADSPRGKVLRDNFAIESKPTTTAQARERWKKESPVWIELTARLGIKLD
ncbi:MAG: tripartite tricarboxylate transporter substrate binding protein [Burkholderiaceae bacterium]